LIFKAVAGSIFENFQQDAAHGAAVPGAEVEAVELCQDAGGLDEGAMARGALEKDGTELDADEGGLRVEVFGGDGMPVFIPLGGGEGGGKEAVGAGVVVAFLTAALSFCSRAGGDVVRGLKLGGVRSVAGVHRRSPAELSFTVRIAGGSERGKGVLTQCASSVLLTRR